MFKYNILTFVFLAASANSLFAATKPKDAPRDPNHYQREDHKSLWKRVKDATITGACCFFIAAGCFYAGQEFGLMIQENLAAVFYFAQENPFTTGVLTGATAVALPAAYIAHQAVQAERDSNQNLIKLQKDQIQSLLDKLKELEKRNQ